jgi:hypothetical protein
MTSDHDLRLSEIAVAYRAADCRTLIRSNELVSVAEAFAANVNGVDSLLTVPLLYVMLPGFISFGLSNNLPTQAATSGAPKSLRHMLKLLRSLGTGGWEMVKVEEFRDAYAAVLSDSDSRPGLLSLLSAATSGLWTAIECVATDAWVVAVNSRPMSLGKHALADDKSEGEIEGLDKKKIDVNLLAKYKYDLRNCLGTLLKGRYDFTGVSGIEKAYRAAFGKDVECLEAVLENYNLKLCLRAVFENHALKFLEALRHIIVHRACIVDDEFKSRAKRFEKETGMEFTIGQPFPFDGKLLTRLATAAIGAGCLLLVFVDTWMVANPD